MSARAPRRRRRVAAGRPPVLVALALVLLALLLPAGPRAAAVPTGAAAPVQEEPATDEGPTIRVAEQNLEVDHDGQFRVVLVVEGATAGSELGIDIFPRISDAAGLAASTTSSPAGTAATFPPIELADEETADDQLRAFTLSVYGPGDDRPPGAFAYRLDEAGVYPVRIRLYGPGGTDTSIVTYLVRRPTDPAAASPARVALLTTVHQDVAETREPADDDGEPAAVGTDAEWRQALDDVLEAFAARPDLPASFAVTPETADRLAQDAEAAGTLTALQAEVGRADRLLTGAPYVDLDPAELVGNGLTEEVVRQADLGERTLAAALALPDDTDRAGADTWVVDHPIDAATVDALAEIGVTRLLVPPAATVAGTPPTRFALPGPTGRSEALSEAPHRLGAAPVDDPLLSAHQLLGRLAALASITPGGTATVLRIDPDTVDQAELEAVLDVLTATDGTIRPTTLDEAFTEGPVTTDPVTLTAPDDRDLGEYPALVRETHDLLGSYASMLVDRADLLTAFERPLALAAATDTDLLTRRRSLRDAQDQLRLRLGAVSAPERDRVTLGARDARFPLPITSSLAEPVRVVITFEASDRLAFPQERIEATLTDDRTVVQIPVRTRATGDTPLRITIRTPDERVILAESRYTVRSTAVSGVGLLLTVGAGGFLALWWGRHWLRTRRQGRHHRTAHHGAPEADLPAVDDDDDQLFVDDPPEPGDVTPAARSGSEPD